MGAVKDMWLDGQERRLSDVQLVMGGLNRLLALFEIDVEERLTEDLQSHNQEEMLDFWTRYEFAVAILLAFVASERRRLLPDEFTDE